MKTTLTYTYYITSDCQRAEMSKQDYAIKVSIEQRVSVDVEIAEALSLDLIRFNAKGDVVQNYEHFLKFTHSSSAIRNRDGTAAYNISKREHYTGDYFSNILTSDDALELLRSYPSLIRIAQEKTEKYIAEKEIIRIKDMEAENERLKRKVRELTIEIDELKSDTNNDEDNE